MSAPAHGKPIVGYDQVNTSVITRREKTPVDRLPAWSDVVAVVAHPDDESFGLGALLAAFVAAGVRVSVLCLTHGETSTLHGVEGDLAAIRARELAEAAAVLGIARLGLAAFPDGALSQVDLDPLVSEIADFVGAARPDGVVAFDRDGVTGHPDHRRATEAAVAYASREHLPVLGTARVGSVHTQCWVRLGVLRLRHVRIDLRVPADRERHRAAVACHRSQALPGVELLGPYEHTRWQDRPRM